MFGSSHTQRRIKYTQTVLFVKCVGSYSQYMLKADTNNINARGVLGLNDLDILNMEVCFLLLFVEVGNILI